MLSNITQIIEAVLTMAQAAVETPIVMGALPPDDGISMAIATGASDETFLNKGQRMRASVVINAKSTNQQTALDVLGKIHDALTLTEVYPSGTTWQIGNIETTQIPMYLEREQNSQYVYGSSVRVDFYVKG